MIHAELGGDYFKAGKGKSKSKKAKAKAKTQRRNKLDGIDSDDSLNDFIDDEDVEVKKKPKNSSRR